MVSLVGIAATLLTGSFAFRKLYQYYWKNPNISVFNSILKSKPSTLRSLYIICDKASPNYSYSQLPMLQPQQHLLFTSNYLFKYLKPSRRCMIYTDSLFSPWNTKQISNLLMNGIEPEIRKFLQVNENALRNQQHYQMEIALTEMNTLYQIQIECERVNPVINHIPITFEELLDENRNFLIFKKQDNLEENYFLILSQTKQRAKYRYSPHPAKYHFTSPSELQKELKEGTITQIWETNNDNPIYKVIQSVDISGHLIPLSDNSHSANKRRFQNILSTGEDYFKMTYIDL